MNEYKIKNMYFPSQPCYFGAFLPTGKCRKPNALEATEKSQIYIPKHMKEFLNPLILL